MKPIKLFAASSIDNQRGSLALEQVLFIGAIVGMAAGLFAFYDDLSTYFTDITFTASPTEIGNPG